MAYTSKCQKFIDLYLNLGQTLFQNIKKPFFFQNTTKWDMQPQFLITLQKIYLTPY